MAEQEIVKHTKKAYTTLRSKEHGFWYKVREFITEIIIIVFAVTISIWLHNWSEHRHEQAQVADFLTDLKDDLHKDIQSLSNAQQNIAQAIHEFSFLQHITGGQIDSMNSIHETIQLNTNQIIREGFQANYEGFKSSGKIGLIENKELKKLILEYNQETLSTIQAQEIAYNEQMNKTTDYATDNIEKSDKDLLLNLKFKTLLRVDLQFADRLNNAYLDAIKKAKAIIADIEKDNKE